MPKPLILAVLCWVSAAHLGFADASISFDDHNGVPDAGSYMPGESFTFDINIAATSTGAVPLKSVADWRVWFATASANTGLFRISAVALPPTSPFTDSFTMFPPDGVAIIASGSGTAIGGIQPSPEGWLGAPGLPTNASYPGATVTIQIAPSAPAGHYSIFSTTTQPRVSGAGPGIECPSCPAEFILAPFPQTSYLITVVPEPATWLLCAVGGSLIWAQVRHRAR